MKEKTLVLVRHGNTFESSQTPVFVGSLTDMPLTEEGRLQAMRVASYLKSESFLPTEIFCGKLLRQVETAEIIAKELGIAVNHINKNDSLQEINYGKWEGLSSDEIQASFTEQFRNWTEGGCWPSEVFGQNEEEFCAPIQAWLNSLLNLSAEKILAVTSNGTLRYIHKFCAGVKQGEGAAQIKVRTGGVCIVKIRDRRFEIVEWNIKP